MDARQGDDPDRDRLLSCLFREHYQALLRLACVLVDDRESGEEIVQDAFISVYTRLERLRETAAAPAYLRSTVLNLARSRLRRRFLERRRVEPVAAGSDSLEDLAVLRDDQRAVLAALRTLPGRQRECLVLRYYADLSEAEIAEALNVSVGSVKTHTSRGRAALAAMLEDLR